MGVSLRDKSSRTCWDRHFTFLFQCIRRAHAVAHWQQATGVCGRRRLVTKGPGIVRALFVSSKIGRNVRFGWWSQPVDATLHLGKDGVWRWIRDFVEGLRHPRSSSVTRLRPTGATIPNSARCARIELITAVCWRTNLCRVR